MPIHFTFAHKKKKQNNVAGMHSAIPIKIKASIKHSCVETIAVSCIKTKKKKKTLVNVRITCS